MVAGQKTRWGDDCLSKTVPTLPFWDMRCDQFCSTWRLWAMYDL